MRKPDPQDPLRLRGRRRVKRLLIPIALGASLLCWQQIDTQVGVGEQRSQLSAFLDTERQPLIAVTVIYLTAVGGGTWTVPADCVGVSGKPGEFIDSIGGGGGSGGLQTAAASGGGGGGGWARLTAYALTPSAGVGILIGDGGAAGVANGGAGTAGGDTSFNGAVVATGGQPSQGAGNGGSSSGGAGGVGSAGSLTNSGGRGGDGSATGFGGGGGGAAGPDGPGVAGSGAGGGAGDAGSGGAGGGAGGAGAAGGNYDGAWGSGGGGGGTNTQGTRGGVGGIYGGGAGGSRSGSPTLSGTTGAQGLIVISYEPYVDPGPPPASGRSQMFILG